jgi:glutamine cyclotransferase
MILFGACSNRQNDTAPAEKPGVQAKSADSTVKPTKTVNLKYQIVREFPHDSNAFTQGLVFYKGLLIESTGQHGVSSLRKIDPKTGNVLKRIGLDVQFFAEGITILEDKVYQLTWESGICFVYDATTFKKLSTFTYFGEGWGLSQNGKFILFSDGSNSIRYIDPNGFRFDKTVLVSDENAMPVFNLNELEYVKGELWANIWQSNRIARINPETGDVTGWLDLTELRDRITISRNTDVLNGIAYDEDKDEFYVTGKNWNKMFVLKITE